MTIETQQVRIIYDGDGQSLSFAAPFPFMEKWHLRVFRGTGELGSTDELLELDIDYSVSGQANPGGSGFMSGEVTLAAPLASGFKLAILRDTPITQEVDYPESGRFPAQSHEMALDKAALVSQELHDLMTRTPYGPATSGASGAVIIEEMTAWYEGAKKSAADAAASAGKAEASAQAAQGSAAGAALSAALAAADADRATALVDPASLASSVFNVRKPFVVEAAVDSGGILTLPAYYYPTRDVLMLGYDGMLCVPRKVGVEAAGEYQYDEIGEDPNVTSNQVRVWFDVAAGDVIDIWVVASAAGRNVEALEALVAEAGEYKDAAAESAEEAGAAVAAASVQADRAEVEADRAARVAGQLPDVNGAQDGQVIVARNVGGTMQAGYENAPSAAVAREHRVLSAALPAGTPYAVPSYIVGSNKLQIFYDSALCEAGAGETYQEVGAAGAASDSIIFNVNLPAGAEVTAIAAS